MKAPIGARVSIRFHDPEGGFRDLVGYLESENTLRNRHGELIEFDREKIALYKVIEEKINLAGHGAPLSVRIQELENVSLVHLDHLSQITDETLEARKAHIPSAEIIIEEIKAEFNSWLETRKFAPTIKALKHKLSDFATAELDTQRKKNADFNEAQAELISNNIIQKITNHFAHHLKDDDVSTDDSLELIKKVFQLEPSTKNV